MSWVPNHSAETAADDGYTQHTGHSPWDGLRDGAMRLERVEKGQTKMKRDMELVREILLKVEEMPFDGAFHDICIEGRSPKAISYHVMLLHEAGFIEAMDLGVCWKPIRLTYSGHEFLDAARSDAVWDKAKTAVVERTGVLTLEGLKVALPMVVKDLIAGHFG